MHARRFRGASVLLTALSLSLLSAPAAAGEEDGIYPKNQWPLRVIKRPLTLAGGMLEIRGDTLRVNLSKNQIAEPVSLAPDVYFGVTNELTVGVTHEVGICITGEDKGCPEVYNDLGLQARYALMRGGNFQLAARGGVLIPRLQDDLTAGVNAGLSARLTAGKLAVLVEPQIYAGALGRDPGAMAGPPAGGIGPKEFLDVPAEIQVQLNPQSAVFLSGGLEGPLDGFGDSFRVPLGLGAVFALNNRFDLGGELRFPNLAGKGGDENFREFIARAALRL